MKRLLVPVVGACLTMAWCLSAECQLPPESTLKPSDHELAEDLNVLATIFRENVESVYAAPSADQGCPALAHQQWRVEWHGATRPPEMPQPLSEYVPGAGVIVQMGVPSALPSASASTATVKPMSRWDMTKSRIQGLPAFQPAESANCLECHDVHGLDKATGNTPEADWRKQHAGFAGSECASCHVVQHGTTISRSASFGSRDAIVEAMVQTILDSRVRKLPPDQSITLSLSFLASTAKSDLEQYYWHSLGDESASNAAANENAAGQTASDATASHVRAADLLFNRGNYSEAIARYRQAANHWEIVLKDQGADNASRTAYLAVLARINAALAAGNAHEPDRPLNRSASRGSPVPARVMLSARVEHIEKYLRGDFTRERLRQEMTVRVYEPPSRPPPK